MLRWLAILRIETNHDVRCLSPNLHILSNLTNTLLLYSFSLQNLAELTTRELISYESLISRNDDNLWQTRHLSCTRTMPDLRRKADRSPPALHTACCIHFDRWWLSRRGCCHRRSTVPRTPCPQLNSRHHRNTPRKMLWSRCVGLDRRIGSRMCRLRAGRACPRSTLCRSSLRWRGWWLFQWAKPQMKWKWL